MKKDGLTGLRTANIVRPMKTAHEIVDGCGGTTALAAYLELTPSTVSSWRASNYIPRWWQERVLKAARRKQFPLEQVDFPSKAQRRSRAA